MELWKFQQDSITKFIESIKDERATSWLNGDEMGLGKTVQAVMLDKALRQRHEPKLPKDHVPKTLVVTKPSLLTVWEDHFKTWMPGVSICVVDPRDRRSFVRSVVRGTAAVYVCHWPILRLPDMRCLQERFWFHVIGDEIQAIKNRKAQVTVAFKKLRTHYKQGLSGTWADNRPDDAWSVLNWLWPKRFTSYHRFYNNHVLFQEKVNHKTGKTYKAVVGTYNEHEIHQVIVPYYVRRTKKDVLKDLPDKYYSTIRIDLTPKQQRAYDDMARTMLAWVGEHESEPIAAPVVISKLIRLQQFACAFGDITEEWRTKTDADGIKTRQLVKVLRLTEPSSKLDAIMDKIEETDEPLVVFGQSKQVINLLAARLQAARVPHGILTGDTPMVDRGDIIADFQAGRSRVFAGTIQAGGVGITLTAASTCVFLDRAWSPSANKQAEDRLHRMGQKNAVHIIDLIANRTLDRERIQVIEQKWEWLKKILDPKGYHGSWHDYRVKSGSCSSSTGQ